MSESSYNGSVLPVETVQEEGDDDATEYQEPMEHLLGSSIVRDLDIGEEEVEFDYASPVARPERRLTLERINVDSDEQVIQQMDDLRERERSRRSSIGDGILTPTVRPQVQAGRTEVRSNRSSLASSRYRTPEDQTTEQGLTDKIAKLLVAQGLGEGTARAFTEAELQAIADSPPNGEELVRKVKALVTTPAKRISKHAESTQKPKSSSPQPRSQTMMINGKQRVVWTQPQEVVGPALAKRYKKEDRHTLEGDALSDFTKEATGYVLSKHNKFALPKVEKAEGKTLLIHLHNVDRQLADIKKHMFAFDFEDTATEIVVPQAVHRGPGLRTGISGEVLTYDLFKDYCVLTPATVAQSNTWYNTYCGDSWTRSNMDLGFELLKKNTEETLFNLCMGEYEQYPPSGRGGPLLLLLIVKRIRAQTEESLFQIASAIKQLKITAVPNEDIEAVVAQIRAGILALSSASSETKTYFPEDFDLHVLQVFQTSSVSEFNEMFTQAEVQARQDVIKKGGLRPTFPEAEKTLRWATSYYTQMRTEGKWDTPKSKASSFTATPGGRNSNRNSDKNLPPKPKGCFNCGKEGCRDQTCPQPRDENKVKKNREAYFKWKKAKDKANGKDKRKDKEKDKESDKPKHIVEDGVHKVLNKKGAYVVDQKKVHEAKLADAKKAAYQQAFTALEAKMGVPPPPSAPPQAAVPPPAAHIADTPGVYPPAAGSTGAPPAAGEVLRSYFQQILSEQFEN